MKRNRNRRRRYPVVKRSLQYRFLGFILGYGLLIVVLMAWVFLIPDLLLLDDATKPVEIRALAADRVLNVHARVWPAVIALLCVMGLHSFRVFHRIAGPLYRFEQVMEIIGKGDFSTRIRLRRKDYLHSEAEAFNRMIESLSERINGIIRAQEEAMETLGELEKALERNRGDGHGEEILSLLSAHRESLEKAEACDRFKMEKDIDGEGDNQVVQAAAGNESIQTPKKEP
ncbi:MAG: methyl-accepting chemotaxis protein [Deltaproteobacteria bacterium]|nr:methyl-accepting chemotaxis protein [Deltaproteobacteria bacterium]MBW2017854.1 methyl-accepting chemotaxis protein [Deltaproteobacteria bacterium]MBW2302167.1 methyl-accepting chemotaxis protein [Deltaproteobacteria bacterium]